MFCEVKTRIVRGDPGPLGPLAAIGAAQAPAGPADGAAVAGGAARAGGRAHPSMRFDAIGITLDPRGRLVALEHLEGAF